VKDTVAQKSAAAACAPLPLRSPGSNPRACERARRRAARSHAACIAPARGCDEVARSACVAPDGPLRSLVVAYAAG
jgi:hypothetical protein